MYVGIPGLCPTRDENSSDDNSDDIMPALLTKRDNAGWDSSDDDSLDDDCDDDEYDLPKSNFADIEIIGNLTSKVRKSKPILKGTKTGISKPERLTGSWCMTSGDTTTERKTNYSPRSCSGMS